MSKHAILLSTWEWCLEASKGKVKIYDFIKPKKKGIRALQPGSICVILTLAEKDKPPTFFGEFKVVEVKEVSAEEYNRLAHLMYKPQSLGPGEKRWIIRFEDFVEYPKKIPKKEFTDVKSSTSKKPLSEWVIMGRFYIDDKVLEGIRRKCGYYEKKPAVTIPSLSELENKIRNIEKRLSYIESLLGISKIPFQITHECIELILLEIGRKLGFKVYTADPSKTCNNIRLGDLVNMDKNELREYAGSRLLDPLSLIDVIWYNESRREFYAFEVVLTTDMRSSLEKLTDILGLRAKLFIVADEHRKRDYEKRMKSLAYRAIKDICKFIPLTSIIKIYTLTKLWTQAVEPLQLHFIKSDMPF